MKYRIISMLTVFLVNTLIIAHTAFAAKTADLSQWAVYGKNLSSCSPGVFQLPNSLNKVALLIVNSLNRSTLVNKNSLYITNEIVGWQNNKCIVNQTSYTQDSTATKVVIHCAYDKVDLTNMADNAKNVSLRRPSVSRNDTTNQIVNKSCIVESLRRPSNKLME